MVTGMNFNNFLIYKLSRSYTNNGKSLQITRSKLARPHLQSHLNGLKITKKTMFRIPGFVAIPVSVTVEIVSPILYVMSQTIEG
jgi:hypothetical protein